MSGATRVLIVDDSRTSRMMIKTTLAQHRPDWILSEVGTGDDAIKVIPEFKPHCISLDMNMPGTDGLTTGKIILDSNPDIKIVLLTANIQESVQKAAHEAGLKFMKKPITDESIGEMIAYFEE